MRQGSFVFESYPGIYLALVAADQSTDVVIHHGGESCLVTDGRHPGGKLRVPDLRVTVSEKMTLIPIV